MGTAQTGPESLHISAAIGLPSFLPCYPVTNMLRKHADNKLRKPGRDSTEMAEEQMGSWVETALGERYDVWRVARTGEPNAQVTEQKTPNPPSVSQLERERGKGNQNLLSSWFLYASLFLGSHLSQAKPLIMKVALFFLHRVLHPLESSCLMLADKSGDHVFASW